MPHRVQRDITATCRAMLVSLVLDIPTGGIVDLTRVCELSFENRNNVYAELDRDSAGDKRFLLAFLFGLAAQLLELGKDGVDIKLARLFLGFRCGGNVGLLARGSLGGRKQGRSGVDGSGFFLVGTLHFEVEINLRGE